MDKVKYYVNLFKEHGITEDTVKIFLEDKEFCFYPDSEMPCPLCSAGCIKVVVLRELGETEWKKVINLMMELYDKNRRT